MRIVNQLFKMRFSVFFGVWLIAVATTVHPSYAIKISTDDNQSGRLYNAWNARDGAFPFAVHVRSLDYCGGCIISPSWVMTVAQCTYWSTTANVYIGSVDYNNPAVHIVSNDLRTHPQYNPSNQNHNLGLINLQQNLIFTDTIRPIAIPRQSQTYENFGAGIEVVIAGWGATSQGSPVSNILRYGVVLAIDNPSCQLFYNSSWVINSVICAEPLPWSPIGLCHGDLGATLRMYDSSEGIPIIGGLASFFRSCSAYPAAYIRPQHYWSWINENTGIPIRP